MEAAMSWLFILLQFAFPHTAAYAQQVKKDVVVSVTYTLEKPKDVCISTFELADVEWSNPTRVVCLEDIHQVGDSHLFQGERIDMVNFMVLVRYPSGKADIIYLTTKVDT